MASCGLAPPPRFVDLVEGDPVSDRTRAAERARLGELRAGLRSGAAPSYHELRLRLLEALSIADALAYDLGHAVDELERRAPANAETGWVREYLLRRGVAR